MEGTVVDWNDSDKYLYIAHTGATSDPTEWNPFLVGTPIKGTTTQSTAIPISIVDQQEIQPGSPGGANNDIPSFDISAFEFVDFTESNPFGDPI